MAHITQKNSRRYRVQFTMRRELHEKYEAHLARAEKLQLVIDFGHDFEGWFANQLNQIGQELERLEAKEAALNSAPAIDQTPGRSFESGNDQVEHFPSKMTWST